MALATEQAEEVMQHNAGRLRLPSEEEAAVRLQVIVNRILQHPEDVPRDQNLHELGFDSLATVAFRYMVVEAFPARQLDGAFLFYYPTINEMAKFLSGQEGLEADLGLPVQAHAAPRKPPAEAGPTPQPRLVVFTQLVVGPVGSPPERPPAGPLKRPLFDQRGLCSYSGTFRRATDGMHCKLLPGATAWIGDGSDDRKALPNERPCHQVALSSFLIDVEPVSIGAYARFLNLVQPTQEQLLEWCLLGDADPRQEYQPLFCDGLGVWRPKRGVPSEWPMILVSWYGANAYSLWANDADWQDYKDAERGFLPSEAQWEYAARGARVLSFPWGDGPAEPHKLNVCWDMEALDPTTPLGDLPLLPVNANSGESYFSGLRGMAGNVWQWCRDTYDPSFYRRAEATAPDAVCSTAGVKLKSERGGSWVGPAHLARSSYRRGRAALAKGRCLGFRCIGSAARLQAELAS